MRHAIYFAPRPGTEFHALGSRWIGRDAFTGEVLGQPDVPGIAVASAEPRRYGFHATLKPPFALRESMTCEALLRAVAALAGREGDVSIRLRVAVLDGFLALVPTEPSDALQRLAESVVHDLDGFRRPASEAELARRRSAPLSPRQEQHLADWGYPYVLEDFRFHMTLTERQPAADVERLAAAAEAHFAPVLVAPVAVDGLTLFAEPSPGAAFLATRHFPFSSSAAEVAA